MTTIDQLVRDYLQAVERAAVDLSDARRRELIQDLSEHIAAERAALDAPTEADVRAILGRLGDPAILAAEARALADEPRPAVTVPAPPRRMGPLAWVLVIVSSVVLICVVFVAAILALFTATGTGQTGGVTVTSVTAPPSR
jgi:hypothetical protein